MAFQNLLPWTTSPLIVNAPMAGFAGPDLAAAVTGAGGLGMMGSDDSETLDKNLARVTELLSGVTERPSGPGGGGGAPLLPVGVGLLLFWVGEEKKRAGVVAVLARHRPAAVWLFAEPSRADTASWARELRAAVPGTQIWVQTNSVGAALALARDPDPDARPDVLVMQGTDAGGHGWARGAGVVSLVPETRDALAREGLLRGPGESAGVAAVVAAGGIVDARGVAAALALGADGVVMGTRFLGAPETKIHPAYRKQVLDAHDGGQQTVKTKLFDELRGPSIWPEAYDGRAIVSQSYEDHVAGVSIDQIRDRFAEAVTKEDKGWGESRRAAVWAGTGVGLVNELRPAADIVREVRDGARAVLSEASTRFT